MKAVNQFSPEQLRQLREYVQQREQQIEPKTNTLSMDQLLNGLMD